MRWLAIALVSILLFAGCATPDEEQNPMPEQQSSVVEVVDGRVRMDVPVPIVTLGFEPAFVTALRDELSPTEVDHVVFDYARSFPTDMSRPRAEPQPNWMLPTAHYTVYDLPEVHAALEATIESMQVDGFVDAQALEAWLYDRLVEAGVPITPQTPGMVLLHREAGAKSYRVQYEMGHIDNARVFGERTPLLVLDASSPTDPWVGQWMDWDEPLSASEQAADELAEAVEHATHFRLLQGPLYPASVRPCHAVTLLVASRATSTTEQAPGNERAFDLLDEERLMRHWERLLGEGNVHIDPVDIRLPIDDPALDQVLRTGDQNTLRYYFDDNWDSYWVPHEGCEAYVSLYVVGDATDQGISGIAMFDIRDGRRFSLSNFNDLDRAFMDQNVTYPVIGSLGQSQEDVYSFDWVNFLFSHETGHLFGQRHPHDVSADDAPDGSFTWSSILTTMSYQVGSKNAEFGTMDHNNHWRNKAASALVLAQEQGLEGTPEYASAIERMQHYAWVDAANALIPVIDPSGLAL